ncbi:hypothetical protein ABN584_14910 [Gloeocapsa sp. BRSZ]
MPIVTDKNKRCQEPTSYQLDLGEEYEDILVEWFKCQGVDAYRPRQRFSDKRLLRQYQRDLLIKLDAVKRLSVEVKALTPYAFYKDLIHIGCTEKWDDKRFRVDLIVLINQGTGEMWTVPTDASEWVKKSSIYKSGNSSGYDYAIHRSKLKPLTGWVEDFKNR